MADPKFEDTVAPEMYIPKFEATVPAVPIDKSIAPPQVLSNQDKSILAPSNAAEFSKQMINKMTILPRVLNKMRQQQEVAGLPEGAKDLVRGDERRMEDSVPLLLKDQEPTSIYGKAGALVGSALEPTTLLTSGVAGKLGENVAEKVLINRTEAASADAALMQAKYQINRAMGDEAVTTLMKNNAIKGVAHGTASGATAGGVSGALDVTDQDKKGISAASEIGGRALAGALGGAALGYGGSLLKNRSLLKQVAQIPEAIQAANTPAHEELAAQLDSLAAERGELQKQAAPLQEQVSLSNRHASIDQQIQEGQSRAAELKRGLDARGQYPEVSNPQNQAMTDIHVIGQDGNPIRVGSLDEASQVPGAQAVRYNVKNQSFQRDISEIPGLVESQSYDPEKTMRELPDIIKKDAELRSQKAQLLASDRDKMLSQVVDPATSQAKLEELQSKLQNNLEQHAALTKAQQQMGGYTVGKNPTSTFAVNQGIEIAQQQYDKAKSILSTTKAFTPEQVNAIAQEEFKNAIELQGLKPALFVPSKLGGASNQVERLSAIGAQTGTNIGEIPLKSIFAKNQAVNEVETSLAQWNAITKDLRSRGWADQDITKSLQYFEKNGFNPLEKTSKTLTRPQWPLDTPPSEQDQASFMKLRSMLDNDHASAVQSGHLQADQFVDGYVPIMAKEGATAPQSRSVQGLVSPRFAQERLSGVLDPTEHEMRPDQMYMRYKKQVAAAQYFAPIIEDGAREIMKLKMTGQDAAAKVMDNYLRNEFALKTDIPIEQMLGHKAVASQINRMSEAGLPNGAFDQVYNEATKSLYKNSILTNPKTVLLHWIQPEVLLPAEVGIKDYAVARASALVPSERAAVRDLLPLTRISGLPATEELMSGKTTNPVAKLLQASGNLADQMQLTRPFKAGEELKRYTSLIAGMNKFNNALEAGGFQGVQKAMSNFLPSEQAFIEKAYRDGGAEAGAKAMALIVDRRTNFSYSSADKPELLKTGLGQYIPYTTYFRNIIARYQGDIQNGNYTQVAKRLVGAVGAASMFEGLTGKDFEEAKPMAAVKRAVSGQNILPAITGPLAPLATRPKSLSDSLLRFTPAEPFIKLKQNLDKTGNLIGLKPTSKDSWLRGVLR